MKRWKKWAQRGAPLGIALWAFACSGGEKSTESTGTAGGNGGSGGVAEASSSSSSSSATSSSSAASVGSGGFGGAPVAFVCDPPAEPGSIYEHSAKSYDLNDIDPVSMCKYRGKVLLVVNTAAI
jgi:hypothetical protein